MLMSRPKVAKPQEVQRLSKIFNLDMVKEDDFVPETCEYYLHYDVSRPLAEDIRPKSYFVKKTKQKKKSQINNYSFFLPKKNYKKNILLPPKKIFLLV